MKRCILFLLLIAVSVFVSAWQQQKVKLCVNITNISNIAGKLRVAVYNDEKDFPLVGKEYILKLININNKSEQCVFDVDKGREFLVAVYQDENNNDKYDKSILRLPSEPYGFSNNIKPRFSSPSFSDVKFRVNTDTTIIVP